METREQLTVLPMERCPGCRTLLGPDAVNVPFRMESLNWRAFVADCYPVCWDCLCRLTDPFQAQCEMVAAEWRIMDQELRWHDHPHDGKPILFALVADPPVPQNE